MTFLKLFEQGQFKFTSPVPPPSPQHKLWGTCVHEDIITELFGGLDEFEALIKQHGDEFSYNGVDVTYNPRTHEHFFWKNEGTTDPA